MYEFSVTFWHHNIAGIHAFIRICAAAYNTCCMQNIGPVKHVAVFFRRLFLCFLLFFLCFLFGFLFLFLFLLFLIGSKKVADILLLAVEIILDKTCDFLCFLDLTFDILFYIVYAR